MFSSVGMTSIQFAIRMKKNNATASGMTNGLALPLPRPWRASHRQSPRGPAGSRAGSATSSR